MNTKLIKTIFVTAMAMILTCGLSSAGERMKAIEMGESGQTVLFRMSPEEIAAEDAEAARIAALIASKPKEPMTETYEMAESGEAITFPMSAEEIKIAEGREAERAAKRAASKLKNPNKPNVVVEEFELCECGEIITFTKPAQKTGQEVKSQ